MSQPVDLTPKTRHNKDRRMSSQQTEALMALRDQEQRYAETAYYNGRPDLAEDHAANRNALDAAIAALAQTAGAPPEDAPAVDGGECQHLSTTTFLNTDITVCMLCDEIVSKNAPPTPAVDGGDAVRKLRIVFDTMECERPAEQARKRLVGEVIEALAAAPAPAVEREAVKLPMRKPQLDIRNPKLYEPGGWDRAIDYNDGFNHALDLVAELNPTTPPAAAPAPAVDREADAIVRAIAADSTWRSRDNTLYPRICQYVRNTPPAEAREPVGDAPPKGWREVIERARAQLGSAGGVGAAGAHNTQVELAVGGPLLDWVEDELTALARPQATPREHPAAQGDSGAVRALVQRLIAQDEEQARGSDALAERLGESHPTYNELRRDASQYRQAAYRLGLVIDALTHPQGEHKESES